MRMPDINPRQREWGSVNSNPSKVFCNNFSPKKGIKMKFGQIINGLTTNL